MAEQAIPAPPKALGATATELLQELIRVDTVNPPGNERALQEQLEAKLTAAGFECQLLAAEPERSNLVARLRGSADGPTLTLLGHVDTVRADPEEWSHDPWSGEIVDGDIWGRGALDMKGQVAAEVAAGLELARGGWRPASGDLLLAIVADEETGGELGAKWLCEQHPDAVRSDFVVNEGGGGAFDFDGRRLYTLCVGEKGIFRFKLRARGVAGHASIPRIGENALVKLAPLIQRLAEQPPLEPTEEGLEFLGAVLGEPVLGAEGIDRGLEALRAEQPLIADYLAEPMLGVTLNPTRAWGSEKANVVPSMAEVLVDCRVPPGMGEPEVRDRVKGLLGDDGYEIEFTEEVAGNRSPADSPLADAIQGWLADADPGAELAPIAMPGFSDSNWFRSAFDAATVYGFCPHRRRGLLEAAPLIHGADERVPVEDLELASRFFFELAPRMLG
jgi:acetylornithine deacetylase/succinyl-diaminopimelate desuccinylase-like protein